MRVPESCPRDDEPDAEAPRLLISACLVGIACRYDGAANAVPALQRRATGQGAVIICPECAGGLSTPRAPAEIVDGDGADVLDGQARVVTQGGDDVTEAFLAGARTALQVAQQAGVTTAILTERSPSCGVQLIHDGHFGGGLRPGAGVTTALLRRHGIQVLNEDQLTAVGLDEAGAA